MQSLALRLVALLLAATSSLTSCFVFPSPLAGRTGRSALSSGNPNPQDDSEAVTNMDRLKEEASNPFRTLRLFLCMYLMHNNQGVA